MGTGRRDGAGGERAGCARVTRRTAVVPYGAKSEEFLLSDLSGWARHHLGQALGRQDGRVSKNPPEWMRRRLRRRLNRRALDRAGEVRLGAPARAVRVPAGLIVLVGPPASGKTSFVQALIAGGQIRAEAVVSSDEIRAELFGAPATETESEVESGAESDAADARIFEERDRRIVARLAAGRSAVAESTNVTPQARARLIAIARRFDAPVTMLRFDPGVAHLLQQYTERGRTDLTAADIRAYAALTARDAGADQLRSEGASAVHDVPGRRQAVTPAEAAALFSFA